MKRADKKKLNKIRGNGFGLTFITIILLCIASVLVVKFNSESFYFYIIDNKIDNEYKSIKALADIYEKGKKDPDIYKLLETEGHSFIITDDSGKVLYENGENTCGDTPNEVLVTGYDKPVTIYQDTENNYFKIDSNKKLILNRRSFDHLVQNPDDGSGVVVHEIEITDVNDDQDVVVVSSDNPEQFDLPIWIPINVNGGQEHFIGKATINVNMRDLNLLVRIVIMILALIGLMILILLINAIRGLVRHIRITNLYFEDDVTGGKNWKWYLYKGEKLLSKASSARQKFASINLTFVNYRNYCLCHSIKEGEKVIKDIHKCIVNSLERKELCVHKTSSSFALLLKYDNEDKLKMRLHELIKTLTDLDENHTFAFQLGVDPIEVQETDSGRIVRRKNIDLDTEYNNACAAKAELEVSTESGIKFFDNKLVENKKWLDTVQEEQWSALRNEEFEVYYQPKYDPCTDSLRGAEALIRWQSPKYGFITPGRFIPIFENNGFITEIDHYMISHVARDQKRWLDQGYKCVPVSVNVSRAHFAEADLAEQIRDMVDEAECPHNLIEIELTESAFFDDKNALIETINRLKNYGFKVSMDDFGAGYSSLNSLKDLPLDILKLDAEFFRCEAEDERGRKVIREAIKLAKTLGMKTVAEGVEEKEFVDFLAGLKCDMIQGYFYAKPMPKNEYMERMSK